MATSKLWEALFGADGTGAATGTDGLLQFLAESAYLWSYRGQHEKAVPIFEALNILAPSDPMGQLGLAEAYLSQKKFREADKAADQAARSSRIDRRTLALAYKLRGKAMIQLKKPRDAEKALRRAAEIDRDGEEGRSALQLIELLTKIGLLAAPAEAAAATDKKK
jgi:tetratricopeptide (TPR) repeat protein